tara:strand:+ start:355 stop:681 length:327 start_codon:yes stop_codon:yes gene_type:complete
MMIAMDSTAIVTAVLTRPQVFRSNAVLAHVDVPGSNSVGMERLLKSVNPGVPRTTTYPVTALTTIVIIVSMKTVYPMQAQIQTSLTWDALGTCLLPKCSTEMSMVLWY